MEQVSQSLFDDLLLLIHALHQGLQLVLGVDDVKFLDLLHSVDEVFSQVCSEDHLNLSFGLH